MFDYAVTVNALIFQEFWELYKCYDMWNQAPPETPPLLYTNAFKPIFDQLCSPAWKPASSDRFMILQIYAESLDVPAEAHHDSTEYLEIMRTAGNKYGSCMVSGKNEQAEEIHDYFYAIRCVTPEFKLDPKTESKCIIYLDIGEGPQTRPRRRATKPTARPSH